MAVYSVSVYPSSTTIKVGSWYYGAYAIVDASSYCSTDVEWYSSNTSVATVNASSGYIYAKGAGTARIYAQSTLDSSKSDYITVTVTSGSINVSSIQLNRSVLYLEKGNKANLTATVLPANATNKSIKWRSTNTNVATVSGGEVTAKSSGYAYIYAEAQDGSGKYAMCYVEVTENVLVNSITLNYSECTLNPNDSIMLRETVCPTDATNDCVTWCSSNESVAMVNPDSGLVLAIGPGTATIRATATDGSGVYAECTIRVNDPIPVTDISICPTSLTMSVGDVEYLCTEITPSNATNQSVVWCSSNESVATVDFRTGKITAKKAGTATITATTVDGCFMVCCDVWVRGKTPVFLIRGRTSNSFATWGAGNRIFTDPFDPDNKDNDHYNPSINALSIGNVQALYTNKTVQDIFGYNSGLPMIVKEKEDSKGETQQNFFVPAVFNGRFKDGEYIEEHPEGGNLAYYLKSNGYKENINLFVFNYPNEDAVKYSAQKFEAYINNLISYVRTSGSNEMKACFYASRSDYDNKNHKINIVGHSMGGLVARYYIENLYQDKYVDKLVTICTPHWGSGYANLSNFSGNIFGIKLHVLSDHDLDFNSAMYGGINSVIINCDKGDCLGEDYIVTEALQYQRPRFTKYYAIAGIDYDAAYVNCNDYIFEMPTNFTTYQEITDWLVSKNVYKLTGKDSQIVYKPNPKSIGDNMVGFMSQIGWTEDNDSPNKKISMEKIFVDVDTNGGNSLGGVFIWELSYGLGSEILHNKIPHRELVFDKVLECLED